jgi:hypothetical protein
LEGTGVSACSRGMCYAFLAILSTFCASSFWIVHVFFESGVPCPCVEGGDDGLHCGRGATGTELVLVLSALSGAVEMFAQASTAVMAVEGCWNSIDARDGLSGTFEVRRWCWCSVDSQVEMCVMGGEG